MRHPFVASGHAAARQSLRRARRAQELALMCALHYFEASAAGRRARELRSVYEEQRLQWIQMALSQREQAKQLQRELGEIANRDTDRPSGILARAGTGDES